MAEDVKGVKTDQTKTDSTGAKLGAQVGVEATDTGSQKGSKSLKIRHLFGLSLAVLTLVLMGAIWWFFKAQEVNAPADVIGYSSREDKAPQHQKERDFINEFYKGYYYTLSAPENPDTPKLGDLEVKYLSQDLTLKLNSEGAKAVMCEEGIPSEPYTVSDFVGGSDDLLNFKLSASYTGDDGVANKRELTVKLKSSGEELQIVEVQC